MPLVFTVAMRGGKRTFRFQREVVTLGRDEGNALRLDDQALSRTHCQFERFGDAVYVRDLGSRNGTWVGDESVTRRRIERGESVRVGNVSVIFEGLTPEREVDSLALKTLRLIPGRREKVAKRSAEDENRRLRQLLEITRRLIGEVHGDSVLETIVDTAVDFTGAERGFLVLFRGGGLEVEVARNYWRRDVDDPEVQISRHVVERVRRERSAVIVEDAGSDGRFASFLSVHALELKAVFCVPLVTKDVVRGVLYLDNRFTRGTFREEDRDMLETFSDLAGLALEQSGHMQEAQRRTASLESEVEEKRADLLEARLELRRRSRGRELKHSFDDLVVESPAMRALVEQVDRIVGTEIPLLIEGPIGTEKEPLARLIHGLSPRRGGPFVPLSCATLPISLAEVELFGHAAGAFTGSLGPRDGIVDEARSGTLFLAGVDDLDIETQAVFLRLLETGEYRRVGGGEARQADIRVIAASARPLEPLVEDGRFRRDLYFRLKGARLSVPPLSQRPEDMEQILRRVLDKEAPKLELTPRAKKALLARSWPGNLVELKNEIRRLSALSPGPVDFEDLSPSEPPFLAGTLKQQVESLERRLVIAALQRSGGNRTHAATMLGLSRPGLRKKLVRYGLESD